jgi:hypothetical protein
MSEDLAVLIKQYAFDLRRNASGGDDYPYEYAKATADYLEELIKRAKGNCTCAQAGFPDSCDNCDGIEGPLTLWKMLRKHGVGLYTAQMICNDVMLNGVSLPESSGNHKSET